MEYKQTRGRGLGLGCKVKDRLAKCQCLFKIIKITEEKISLSLIKEDILCIHNPHKKTNYNHFVAVHDKDLIVERDIYCI